MEVPLLYCSLYPVIRPLWCGQGTVPHTILIELLSTDVVVSSPGAPVGAGEGKCSSCTEVRYHWCVVPAVKVLVEKVIVLLLPSTSTAVTVTVQLLPALREEMVCLLIVPDTVIVCTDGTCESHKS